jgi:hypothetical protein
MDDSLRRELLVLMAEDDALREELAKDGSLFQGYNPDMEALHRRNAARLREIIAAAGWPGRSLVGEDGAAAAWRILQHSIGEPGFMRGSLPVLSEAVAAGEAEPLHLAMLEDRILCFEGRPQLYGTQYFWDEAGEGMTLHYGVEDPEGIEERRRAVGLPPIEWRRPAPPGERPPDRTGEARERELDDWARSVGWR